MNEGLPHAASLLQRLSHFAEEKTTSAAASTSTSLAILAELRQGLAFALAQACARSVSWPVPAVHVRLQISSRFQGRLHH
jgi:hypothetical protein